MTKASKLLILLYSIILFQNAIIISKCVVTGLNINDNNKQKWNNSLKYSVNRRTVLSSSVFLLSLRPFNNDKVFANEFESKAFELRELTNSITASRDTNISPLEAYNTIQLSLKQQLPNTNRNRSTPLRALDLGAGAGASTQLLWELGYRTIDAVDWTQEAWDSYVTQQPNSVTFYEMDADTFRETIWRKQSLPPYDAIVFNFAVNESKAISFAKELLLDSSSQSSSSSSSNNSVLLAPVNTQRDYWMKQSYKLYDSKGDLVRAIGDNVDAWSVQFQPDVSENTCVSSIWCPPFNGFKKK